MKILGPIKSGGDVILDVRFTSEDSFTTTGVKHYYVWDVKFK